MAMSRGQKLNRYGVGMTSPLWWQRAIRLQAARMDQHRVELEADLAELAEFRSAFEGEPEADQGALDRSIEIHSKHGHRLLMDGFFMASAIRQLLRYADHYVELTRSEPSGVAAREAFLSVAGEPKLVRDVLEHLDEYAVGQGRYRASLPEPDKEPSVVFFEDGEVELRVAGLRLPLKKVSAAAGPLVKVLIRLPWTHGAWGNPDPATAYGDGSES
jgi:hypothetical protein